MKRKRFSEAQIIGVLQEAEAGVKKQDLCRKHGITEQTFYRWRAKYGGLRVSDVTRLKQLEEPAVEAVVGRSALGRRNCCQKTGKARCAAPSGGPSGRAGAGEPAAGLSPRHPPLGKARSGRRAALRTRLRDWRSRFRAMASCCMSYSAWS